MSIPASNINNPIRPDMPTVEPGGVRPNLKPLVDDKRPAPNSSQLPDLLKSDNLLEAISKNVVPGDKAVGPKEMANGLKELLARTTDPDRKRTIERTIALLESWNIADDK